MSPIGKIGERSSGPIGCPVPGLSGGGGIDGRSAATLYQRRGIASSSRRYRRWAIGTPLSLSSTARPYSRARGRCDPRATRRGPGSPDGRPGVRPGPTPPARGGPRRPARAGSQSVNVEPVPTSLSTVTRPPSSAARRRTIESPRPEPPDGAVAAGLDAVEPVEDERQVLRRDAAPGVADRDPALAGRAAGSPGGWCRRGRSPRSRWRSGWSGSSPRAPGRRPPRATPRGRCSETPLTWASTSSRATASRPAAARSTGSERDRRVQVEPGELLQVAHQLAQACRLRADERGRLGAVLRAAGGAVLQRLGEALDGGDRGAQLVGDVGEELALAHVGRLEPRGHPVEGLRQAPELVVALGGADVEAPLGDGLGAVGQRRRPIAAGARRRRRPASRSGRRCRPRPRRPARRRPSRRRARRRGRAARAAPPRAPRRRGGRGLELRDGDVPVDGLARDASPPDGRRR